MSTISPGPFQFGTNFGFFVVSNYLKKLWKTGVLALADEHFDEHFVTNFKSVRHSIFVILFFCFLPVCGGIIVSQFS